MKHDEWLTPPAEQQAAQVIIDFSQVGTAGPFPVVNGRVSLPDATMQDLARMLRPTYEAEQQAAPKTAPTRTALPEGWTDCTIEFGNDGRMPAQETAMLSDDKLWDLWNAQGTDDMSCAEAFVFARAIEAEARMDALEEAAAAVEKATYSKRWAKAAINSHPDDVPPCEFAALILTLNIKSAHSPC